MAGVLMEVVLALALLIPAAPAFVGTFHLAAAATLAFMGANPGVAGSYAMVIWLDHFVSTTLLGMYYLWRLGLGWEPSPARRCKTRRDKKSYHKSVHPFYSPEQIGLPMIQAEVFNVPHAELELAGRLHRPQGGARALAVISHGLESSKDSAKLTRLAASLADLGYLALRFDHAGCGDSPAI